MMNLWLLLPAVAALSLLLTAGLRRYAIARSLIDVPNARSSHQVPTPRGGGVAIVLSFLLAVLLAAILGAVKPDLATGILGAGIGIALLGFLDDHGHIAARWRLLLAGCCTGLEVCLHWPFSALWSIWGGLDT